MRDIFLDKLYNIAKKDRSVILLSSDFGAPSLDKFRKDLPNQFINVGIAEQNMINVARGLAMAGRIVYTYAILPFYMRCYEQIRHLCFQNLSVNMIGVGAGLSYCDAGLTHWALEDIACMSAFPNLTIYNPSENWVVDRLVTESYLKPSPTYIRLDRYSKDNFLELRTERDIQRGFSCLRYGQDLVIITTGNMVYTVMEVANIIEKGGVKSTVIDLFRIRPFNQRILKGMSKIVTVEENFNGIGNIVAQNMKEGKVKQIALKDYILKYTSREELHYLFGIDRDNIIKEILEWI